MSHLRQLFSLTFGGSKLGELKERRAEESKGEQRYERDRGRRRAEIKET